MKAWKLKKNQQASRKPKRGWGMAVAGAILVLATLGAAVYDFPGAWNGAVASKWEAARLPESGFRLGLDLQGGTHLVYEADMSEIPDEDRLEALEGVRDVIERRVNAFGVSEPVVQTVSTGGVHRVVVELAGVLDVNEAIKQIGETPVLEFKEPGESLEREPTQEELDEFERRQDEDRQRAEDILAQAEGGADFDVLASENSSEPNAEISKGRLEGVTSEGLHGPIGEAIESGRVREGRVVGEVVETVEGLNVVKYVEENETEQMLLSHILICSEESPTCPNPIPAIEASIQINAIADEATTENFADLAKERSVDGSAPDGGDLGWVSQGETIPAFELAAAALDVGEISDVIETEFGFHLIHKRDQRTAPAYTVQRVLLPLTKLTDVVPAASPWTNTDLSGKHLERSSVEFDPNTGAPYVALNFNQEGGDLFGDLTERLVGQPMAIFLDGMPISTPVIQQAIYGGKAVITGDFTLEEAKLLSQRLNAGALPVPVDLLSQQTVGPTLGAISLERSVEAGLLGLLLVGLFMIAMYRLPGLLATIALILYAFMNLAAYRVFGVTVTLAGIAGFVLSLGIAVDANVLIIERFKEELRAGRDVRSAAEEGFRRAWTAIRDGNITTLIAAGVLYFFSSSFIRGFALTLSIGVLLSMFTAIVVTRVYVLNAIKLTALRHPWLLGARK